jgi:hypothetical protein
MKFFPLFLMTVLSTAVTMAQDKALSTNSMFDDSDLKSLTVKSITVQGEVQDPGQVDLSALPLRSVAIKEVGLDNGQHAFKGAYFVSGYSLFDILNSKKVKKAAENTFGPPVDLYAIVENDKGEKAVFSWGEIYYRNSFDILITRNIQAINPARAKTVWPLPDVPRLICAEDLLNVRYISNPTRITVKSFHGAVPKDKPQDITAPEVRVVSKVGTFTIKDVAASAEKRTYTDIGYGHGMGFKGVQSVSGYLLKDLIAANFKLSPEALAKWIVVASAKDGYRSVISLSELMNRSDNQDIILIEKKEPGAGRYMLYPVGDYFADRDVRAVEKIELLDAD